MATPAGPEVDDGLEFIKLIYGWTYQRLSKCLCNQLTIHPNRESWQAEYKYWIEVSRMPLGDVDSLSKAPILDGDMSLTPEQRTMLATLKTDIITDILAGLKEITEQEQYPPSPEQKQVLYKLGEEWDAHDGFVLLLLYVVSPLVQHTKQVHC
jgi:hypothetical protein